MVKSFPFLRLLGFSVSASLHLLRTQVVAFFLLSRPRTGSSGAVVSSSLLERRSSNFRLAVYGPILWEIDFFFTANTEVRWNTLIGACKQSNAVVGDGR